MKKIVFLLFMFIYTGMNAQVNMSTGLTGFCGLDPDWQLFQTPPNPSGPGPYSVFRSSAAASYEPQPHVPTGAHWVNQSCSHIANPIGVYLYRRNIPVPAAALVLNLNFKLAWDDTVRNVILRDPGGSPTNLTALVLSNFTSTEQLTSLNFFSVTLPTPGNWTLEVETAILNNTGGIMLAGSYDFNATGSTCTVTAGNINVCPCAVAVPLIGTPPGGTFSIPNPFTPPVLLNQTGPVVYPYTYTATPPGCVTQTATGTVTVNYQVPAILSPVGVTSLSAKICWTPVACNALYKLEYRQFGTIPWCTPGLTSSNCMTLCGNTLPCRIIPGTLYQVRVKAVYQPCGATSAWSPITLFTTLNVPCGTNTCASILPTSISIPPMVSWTTCPSAGAYNVQVTQTTPPCSITFCIPNATQTSYVLPPCFIPGNTTCSARIRTKCNPGCATTCVDPWAAWGPWTSFVPKGEANGFITSDQITIFPNPTNGIVNVELDLIKEQKTTIKLFDLTGRMIKQMEANSVFGLNAMSIDMSQLAQGAYLIQVLADDKLVQVSKVIRND